MKTQDFEAIGRTLLPNLPGFAVKGCLLFARPVRHLLRGACFDDSSFDTNLFFVHAFVQPLYVPFDTVALNLGWRLGGAAHRWDAKDPELIDKLRDGMRGAVMPFLLQVSTPLDLVETARRLNWLGDVRVRESVAYSLARAGNAGEAMEALEDLVKGIDPTSEWQRQMADQAEGLRNLLDKDPAGAQSQLDEWENQTIHHLRLEKYR